MAFIKAVTGRGITTSIALELTDLGIMRWDSDRNCIAAMFGDSFSFSWGQDWRSPVIACYDPDFNVLGVPVVGGIATQPARQLWEYGHNNPQYSTVLPCDFIRVGPVWHVAVMLTQGLGNEKMTEFWHSSDLVTWTLSGKGFAHPGSDRCTTMLSFDQFGDQIYVAGTHGLRRDGPIKMWRVPADSFPHGKWELCNDGRPIREGRHGELCLRNVQGNAVLAFFDEQGYKQTALTVSHPEDDWSLANGVDYAWGSQTPQLYGGYIAPHSKLDEPDGMKFFVSQWGTARNWPYHVLAFSGTLQAKGRLDLEEPASVRSENGWEPGWVDASQLEWVDVPGVAVRLQLRKGQPASIMKAFAADYHAYVEHLRDPDSAGYRPADSVATSNHLNGTAMDLNHTTHQFRTKGTFSAGQQAVIRELLDWYEGTIFWGGDWLDPVDEMHWQMGGSTFGNPHTDEFIAQKIRPDGYSTFRRGAMPAADTSKLLFDAMGGSLSLDRYAALAPAATRCLKECGCTTVNRIAMWCAQIGHESAGLRYMEEIADGSAYEGRADLGNTKTGDGRRFKGRGPIQVTGRNNYTECSKWAYSRGLVPSPSFFVDYPHELATDEYGFIGVTWYWTTQRPLNEAADAGDLERATRYINGGLNGLEDRRRRYSYCKKMGSSLLGLVEEPEGTFVGEKVLAFDTSIIPQQTGYWCGPASAQIALAVQGLNIPEAVLARECGTHTGGTDHIRLIERCLDARLPGANYTSVDMPNDPPTRQQKELLWQHLSKSIDAGYALIMNWVAPPNNYPRGVKGSPNLQYSGGTVYHYVACTGYDDRGARAVLISDPGFRPFLAWISFDQCATLLPPKGYAYADATPVVPTPPVVIIPPPEQLPKPPAPVTSRALGGRPHDHNTLPVSVEDALLDMRAEGLLTQALVYALCQKLGVDAELVYQRVKGSFNE